MYKFYKSMQEQFQINQLNRNLRVKLRDAGLEYMH